jgi:hypothetical protein
MMNQTDQNAVIDSLRTSKKDFEEIDFLTLVVQESQQYLEDLTQQQIQEEL